MTTELTVESGMHIEPDAKTGAIAASTVNEDIEKIQRAKDDQPEQSPTKEGTEEQKVAVNPRDAIMKSIYEGRAKQFSEELEYAKNMGATSEPANDEVEAVETKEEPEQPVKEKTAKVETEQPVEQQPAKKRYIINGQSVDLTEQEIANIATRGVQSAQALQAQQQMLYQQPQQQQVQTPPQQQPALAPDNERLKDIARKITYGNEEDSVKALQDFAEHTIRTVQRAAGPTPEQIAQFAAGQAVAQVNFQTNLDTIAREYPDVFEKRASTLVAADYVNSLRNKYAQLGMPKPDIELYREACNYTRVDFGKAPVENTTQSDTSKPTVVQVTTQKVERKRAAPQPPASVSRVLSPQAERAKTGSDIVNAMRKQRGQSAMN